MAGRKKSLRDEDFEEEDVWAAVKERDDISSKGRKAKDLFCSSSSSSSSSARRVSTSSRMIPRANSQNLETKMAQQSSAPMDIPDWSKIYRKKTSKKGSRVDDDDNSDYDGVSYNDPTHHDGDDGEDDGDGDDDEIVPPHEWIARKLARSQISSFSVCEGIGRTLKGRDLSKVRNTILTKTGFLE